MRMSERAPKGGTEAVYGTLDRKLASRRTRRRLSRIDPRSRTLPDQRLVGQVQPEVITDVSGAAV